jgi:hypothetical protein
MALPDTLITAARQLSISFIKILNIRPIQPTKLDKMTKTSLLTLFGSFFA